MDGADAWNRFRGIVGTCMVLLMHRGDIDRLGFTEGSVVIASTFADVTAHDIPKGSCAGYCPELNPLIPLWHHAEERKVPAAKNIPIVLRCHRSPLR